jgi:hypothetical protein
MSPAASHQDTSWLIMGIQQCTVAQRQIVLLPYAGYKWIQVNA